MKKRIAVFLTLALTLALCFAVSGCTHGSKEDKNVHTVTFDYNYDGAQNVTSEVEEGEKVSKPANPTREGYNFNGWYLYGAAYDFNAAVTEDITIEAYWRDSSIVDPVPAITYGVAFEETEGITYDFGGAKPEEVTEGSEVKFSLRQSPYYFGTPVVKANGAELSVDADGAYSFEAIEYTTVTVEGLKPVSDLDKDELLMGGKGTAEEPYTISSPVQWVEFAFKANNFLAYKNMYYVLDADIDFGGEEIPIVDEFSGFFGGQGHTMSNYKISYTEVIEGTPEFFTTVGLFGYLGNAYVVRLNLKDFKLSVSSNSAVCVGGIAALSSNSDIIGCNVSGEITYANASGYVFNVGGLVGQLVGTADRNASMVTMCASDVIIRGDATGTVGGIAGAMYGRSALSPAFVANCAVSGNLTGGTAGGIVGEAGAYSSVTDSYFTGTVKADASEYQRAQAEAGGIIGIASSSEVAVTNCVSAGTVTAKAYTPDLELSDALVGSLGSSRFGSAPIYSAQTLIYNSYRMVGESLQLYDGNAYAGGTVVENFGDVDALLGWVDAYWIVSEENLFPMPDGSKYNANALFFGYRATINFPGETINVSGTEVSDRYVTAGNAQAVMYYPVSWVMGTDGNMLISQTEGHISTGYYKGDVRLPAAYLLNRENATVELGFADYTEISDTYYTLAGGREYEITFGVGGEYYMARFESAAKSADVPFVYFGDGTIIFPSVPAEFSSGAAYAVIDYEEGAMFILGAEGQIAVARPYNEYVGVWYDKSVTFLFNVDGTGLFLLGENLYGFEYKPFKEEYEGEVVEGVMLYIGGQAVDMFVFTEGKLVGGTEIFTRGVSLGREDAFAGYYETDMYSGHIVVAFDGNGKAVSNIFPDEYDYVIENNKAVIAELGATFEFDSDGFLVCTMGEDEIAFGALGSSVGVWSDPRSGYKILFAGITSDGFGYAADSNGNTFRYEYSNSNDIIAVYYGVNLYAIARLGIANGMYVLSFQTASGSALLYLDDNFNGVWYSDESDDAFVFMYGLTYMITEDGESEVVGYSYVDGDMDTIEFTVGDTVYTAKFTDVNQVEIDGVYYRTRDAFAGVDIMSDDGMVEMVFDGNGEFDIGMVLRYDYRANKRTILAYRVDTNGTAVVFDPEDENENTLFAVGFDEDKGLWLIEYADETAEYYGIGNMYTGEWSVQGEFSVKISVGVLDADYNGKAIMHVDSNEITVDVKRGENGGIVLYSEYDGMEYYTMLYTSQYGMRRVDGNGKYVSMALTDELAGVWKDAAGRTLTFDGAGYNNTAYFGICRFAVGKDTKDYYYGISSDGLSTIYVPLSSGTYQYFTFLQVPADMYGEVAEQFGSMVSNVFYNAVGDECIILLGNMSDSLTGFTYTIDDETQLQFAGNDMYYDAFVTGMIGYNYVLIGGDLYLYQPVEAQDGVYVIYAYSMASLSEDKFTPDYVITVYTDAEGNPESAEVAEYDDAMIFEGLFAA